VTDDLAKAIRVDSVGQEYAIVAATPCACGGRWRVIRQALVQHAGRFGDRLEVTCAQCGATGVFLFDISAFFGAPL